MNTTIIISVLLILLGLTFLFISKLWSKIEKRINCVTWVGFLVSLAGLIVTVFSIVPKVTTINNFNIKFEKQVEKQIRQIEEKVISKTDTIKVLVIQKDTVIYDAISIPGKPENNIKDEAEKVERNKRIFFWKSFGSGIPEDSINNEAEKVECNKRKSFESEIPEDSINNEVEKADEDKESFFKRIFKW
jgi:hypothetical protein